MNRPSKRSGFISGYPAGGLLAAWLGLALFCTIVASTIPQAQEARPMVDAHKVFEQGCKRCHNEHGADFARQKLKIVDDQLQVARTGKALAPILSNHHGVKLSEPERAALFDLFMKGIDRKGAFQHRCALCHGRAVDFAREKLHIKDDVLKSKADDKDVARFLTTHHEATPAELDTIVSMLKWQLQSGR